MVVSRARVRVCTGTGRALGRDWEVGPFQEDRVSRGNIRRQNRKQDTLLRVEDFCRLCPVRTISRQRGWGWGRRVFLGRVGVSESSWCRRRDPTPDTVLDSGSS